MKFGVIKVLCLCGCVFGSMCEDTEGMRNTCTHMSKFDIGAFSGSKEISFSGDEQFFDVDDILDSGIKSVYLEDLNIDDKFNRHWFSIFGRREFDSIEIVGCHFSDSGFGLFDGLITVRLSLISCCISDEDIYDILGYLNPYSIEQVDFSFNNLGKNVALLKQNFERSLVGKTCVIRLTGNMVIPTFLEALHGIPSLQYVTFEI